jgi:hypothetical protein
MPWQDEFLGKLDETLVLAITGEYDLDDSSQFDAARKVLLAVAENAEAELAADFNPSGIPQYDGSADDASSVGTRATGSKESSASSSKGTRSTTAPSESAVSNMELLSVLDFPNVASASAQLDALSIGSEEQALEQLKAIFVELKEQDITFQLKKAKGDYGKAVDALLNIRMLDEEGLRPKGIDAFFRPDDEFPKKRKGKKKARAGNQPNPASTPGRGPGSEEEVYMQRELTW